MAEPHPSLSTAAIFDISGRVAMITDGGGALGGRFAELLALNGAQVALAADGRAELAGRVEDIRARGGAACSIIAGLESPDGVRAAFEAAEAAFGPVGIVIHLNRPASDDASEFEAPLARLMLLAAEARKRMSAGGTIVNVTALPDTIPGPENARSWLDHAGMERLSRLLSRELGPSGIRLNNLASGAPSHATDDLDGAILFLASDASRFLTGATLTVDGARILYP